jgi:hypothetical protein
MPSPLSSSSTVGNDLEALLVRMRQRQYPDTIPVLVSFWLKTVYAAGHKRPWWKELSKQLRRVLREELLAPESRQALLEVDAWIQKAGVLTSRITTPPRRSDPFRTNIAPERLAPYISRLLNQWLSAEVARLMVDEGEAAAFEGGGIPALAVGKALERLLVRERLSPGTLETLLQPELLSPRYAYPADVEMLRDVVLYLSGRTAAPAPPVMPAIIVGVPAGSPLPADYREAVRHASFVEGPGGGEVHVPIPAAQGLDILKGGPVRLASLLVTMDGRWWESENLQSGELYSVVYKPGGRLRIDYSADHVKLALPWPDSQLRWVGGVHFSNLEIFGREWRVSSWETGEDRTWLHLVFSRALELAEVRPAAETSLRRSRPAAIDIAWAAIENALAASIFQESREPIEELRRSEFVPLGRGLFELASSLKNRRLPKPETLQTQLRAIRYLQAEVSLEYGLVPWRILPAPARAALLRTRHHPDVLELLHQVFEGLPEALSESALEAQASHSDSPSQAA